VRLLRYCSRLRCIVPLSAYNNLESGNYILTYTSSLSLAADYHLRPYNCCECISSAVCFQY
jgi:hypothetical protein